MNPEDIDFNQFREDYPEIIDWNLIDSLTADGVLSQEQQQNLYYYAATIASYPIPLKPEYEQAWSHYLDIKDDPRPGYGDTEPDQPQYDEEFNEDEDYYSPDDYTDFDDATTTPIDQPPPVPGGEGTNGGPALTVNTEALRTFGKNMLTLRDSISASRDYVNQVDIKPGIFQTAFDLRGKIQGSGEMVGLQQDTFNFMDNTSAALLYLDRDIGKLILDYNETEELNALSGEKLSLIMDAFDTVDKSDEYGQTDSTGNSNEDGQDEDDGGDEESGG